MQKGAAWSTGMKQRSQANLASHGPSRCASWVFIGMEHPMSLPCCSLSQPPLLPWASHRVLKAMPTLGFSDYPSYPNYQFIQRDKWLSDTFWKTQHQPWRRLWLLSSLTLWLEIWTASDNQVSWIQGKLSIQDIQLALNVTCPFMVFAKLHLNPLCFISLLWSLLVAPSHPGTASTVLNEPQEWDQSSNTSLLTHIRAVSHPGASATSVYNSTHWSLFWSSQRCYFWSQVVDLCWRGGWAITHCNEQASLFWSHQCFTEETNFKQKFCLHMTLTYSIR